MFTCLQTFQGHRDSVTTVCVNPWQNSTFASGSEDGSCRLWDSRTTKATQCFTGMFPARQPDVAISSIVFEDETSFYVAADRTIFRFDLRHQRDIICTKALDHWTLEHAEEINTLTLSSSSSSTKNKNKKTSYLAASDDNGSVHILERNEHQGSIKLSKYKTLRGRHTNLCTAAIFLGSHRPWELMSGSLDGHVIVWDFSRGKPKHKVNFHTPAAFAREPDEEMTQNQMLNPPFVHAVAVHPSDKSNTVAVAVGDGSIALLELERTGPKVQEQWSAHAAACCLVSFPTPERILSIGNDQAIKLWKMDDPERRLSSLSSLEIEEPLAEQVHEEKMNWIDSDSHQEGSLKVYVADVSPTISLYAVH